MMLASVKVIKTNQHRVDFLNCEVRSLDRACIGWDFSCVLLLLLFVLWPTSRELITPLFDFHLKIIMKTTFYTFKFFIGLGFSGFIYIFCGTNTKPRISSLLVPHSPVR